MHAALYWRAVNEAKNFTDGTLGVVKNKLSNKIGKSSGYTVLRRPNF